MFKLPCHNIDMKDLKFLSHFKYNGKIYRVKIDIMLKIADMSIC
jgi:hypothetical protein